MFGKHLYGCMLFLPQLSFDKKEPFFPIFSRSVEELTTMKGNEFQHLQEFYQNPLTSDDIVMLMPVEIRPLSQLASRSWHSKQNTLARELIYKEACVLTVVSTCWAAMHAMTMENTIHTQAGFSKKAWEDADKAFTTMENERAEHLRARNHGEWQS
ncbi:hypothetical protein Adt_03407 [Abeliophyllum distichum]|uniref:Uncharacterized protein n=1 Tax=Abeliophyllum distichum TaxID=126358 RepID=A0ABD1VYE7_9LAMI